MQGKQLVAERFANRALRIKEELYGPENPEVAVTLRSLGDIYFADRRYPETERLYRRALRTQEKQFQPD